VTKEKAYSNIALKSKVLDKLDIMWKKEKEKNKNREKFGSFVNDNLENYLQIYEKYGDQLVLMLKSNNKLLQKFLDVSDMIRTQPDVLERFSYNILEKIITDLLKIRDYPNGTQLDRRELNILIHSLFEGQSDIYFGTTSLPPSEYSFYLENYLSQHALAIKDNRIKKSIRVVIVSKADLYLDYRRHPDKFRDFVEWHKQWGDSHEIYQIEPSVCASIVNQCENKPLSSTMGLWGGSYAATFFYTSKLYTKDKLEKIIGVQISTKSEPNYKAVDEFKRRFLFRKEHNSEYVIDFIQFYEDLEKKLTVGRSGYSQFGDEFEVDSVEQILDSTFTPPEYDDELASRWYEIVNCHKRLKTSLKFILGILSRYKPYYDIRILDASGGSFCEAVELVKEGHYSVTCNEPDPILFKKSIYRLLQSTGIRVVSNKSNSDKHDSLRVENESYYEKLEISRKKNSNSVNLWNNEWSTLEAYNLTWNHLKYQLTEKFKLIFSFGNFISHIPSFGYLSSYLEDLRDLFDTRGGILLLDHRNFGKVNASLREGEKLSSQESVHATIIDYINRYNGKYMYCNPDLVAAPSRRLPNGNIELVFRESSGRILPLKSEMVELHPKAVFLELKKFFTNIEVYEDHNLDNRIDIDFKSGEYVEKVGKKDNDYFVYKAEYDPYVGN
jgi:hypothetical protein